MCPTPDMFDDGSAFRQVDPLSEQLQREPNPWNASNSGLPVASQGGYVLAAPVPAVAPARPISTPWGTAPGVQFAPADIGGGDAPRVPPPAQMPMGLGGGFNLSQTGGAVADEEDVDDDDLDLAALPQQYLNLSADELVQLTQGWQPKQRELLLAVLKAAARNALPDSDFAIPEERKFPIHDEGHARNALSRAAGTKYESRVRAAVKKRYKNIDVNAAQEHGATVFFNLSDDGGQMQNGLLWKVLCKTGTLALSPGPGQVDMEKPLELTPDLFMSAKAAFDEKAFEHVVIPAKHEDAHDPLANHGTVDALEVLNKDQALADLRLSQQAKDQLADDPADTMYMLGGLHFTEPDTRAKAERGSILNCSVGFKFNVRPNKLTGKTYPVAIEHVALTQQPWVYGLPAFGTANLGGPFNIEDEMPWDGVFLAVDAPVEDPPSTLEGTLPPDDGDGELPHVTDTGDPEMPTTQTEGSEALEQILADLTARAERAESQVEDLQTQLSQTNGVLSATSEQLHAENVGKKVRLLQLAGIAPAVLTRVEALMLADKPVINGDGSLSLSATVPGEDGTPVQREFGSVTEIVDFVLSAMPKPEGFDPSQVQTEIALAQREQADDKSTGQKADDIERRLHPDRFDGDGKRIPASERTKR